MDDDLESAPKSRLWRVTVRLSMGLLLLWLAVNVLVPWFARDLNLLQVLGFPGGYWLAAEGLLLFYLVLIVVYVLVMETLERRLEGEQPPMPMPMPMPMPTPTQPPRPPRTQPRQPPASAGDRAAGQR